MLLLLLHWLDDAFSVCTFAEEMGAFSCSCGGDGGSAAPINRWLTQWFLFLGAAVPLVRLIHAKGHREKGRLPSLPGAVCQFVRLGSMR